MCGRGILRRLGQAGVSLLFLTVAGFLLFRVLPGDPVRTMTRGRPVTAEQLRELRARLGVDRPWWAQFTGYVSDLARGDLGTSVYSKQPVAELIGERLGPTALLLGTATVLAALLGGALGVRAGWRPGGGFDRVATAVAIGFWSTPAFWLGMVLVLAFGGLFPTQGFATPEGVPVLEQLHRLVLPCLTLVLVQHAQFMLVTRSSALGERDSAYVLTARAKGLRDNDIRGRHVLPNALLPATTLVFTRLGALVAGAVTVEAVFSWPGLGQLIYQALRAPDLPVLQGTFLLLAASVILLNLIADLLCGLLDPRVRTA